MEELSVINATWKVAFDPAFGGPAKPVTYRRLSDWSKDTDSLIKYYSGSAVYSCEFKVEKEAGQQYFIDLGDIACVAELKVNGISCGVTWTRPYRLNITEAMHSGSNQLDIEVTNTWANRLIGDQRLPEEKRITRTTAPFRLEGKVLNEAGLLGPVRILKTKAD